MLTLRGHTDIVPSVVFSPDGNRLVSAGADGTVQVREAGPSSAGSPIRPNPTDERPGSHTRRLSARASLPGSGSHGPVRRPIVAAGGSPGWLRQTW